MHTSISRAQIPLTKAVLLLSVAISPTILHGAAPQSRTIGPFAAMLLAQEARPTLAPKALLSKIDAAGAVLLRTEGSTYEAYAWSVYPTEAQANFLKLKTEDGEPVGLCFYPKDFTVVFACCATDANALKIDVAVVHVKRNGPNPPDPPKGKYQIVFFHESADLENLPAAQRALLSSLVIRKQLEQRGHKLLGVYDPDITGPDGLPSRLKGWWEAIKGDKLPRVAFSPLTGGDIWDYPLPADAAALWKLLEEGGK